MKRKKIAVAFFGITRSLSYTIDSINRNVLGPARDAADVSVYAHFFDVKTIDNARSGELGKINPDEYKLLEPDWVQFTKPDTILAECGFDEISSFGDHWDDGFKSISNLLHQLYSLKTVTNRLLQDAPDVVVFCRPDLEYHDSMADGLRLATSMEGPLALLPYWQRHKGGLNDRFSICAGEQAISAYGKRLDLALPFCRNMQIELHSERLIRYALAKSDVPIKKLNVRASRVRTDGRMMNEDFTRRAWKTFRNYVRFRRMMRF